MTDTTKKLMVVASSFDTTDKRSARFQQNSEYITVGDILSAVGWKYYKAFITQTGTDNPVIQVLNENEPDYLGEIGWTFNTDHIEGSLQDEVWSPFVVAMPVLLDGTWVVPVVNGNTSITIAGEDFAKTYIEIKMKVAGAAPVLIGASVNGCGTAITLVFDKNISAQGIYDAWVTNSDITASGGSGGGVASNVLIDGSNVTLLFDDRYALKDDTITVTIADAIIMSSDYGVYGGVSGNEVTNIITAANPTFVSAVVPADGLSIICTFSKAMTPPECADGFTFTLGAAPFIVGRVDKGTTSAILVLTNLESVVYDNDVVTVERDATAICACGVFSADGGCLGAITAGAVTNNSEVPNK